MFAIRDIQTLKQAQTHLDEVTRHRLDLVINPPTTRPRLVDRKRDAKLGIVWLLKLKMDRLAQNQES